MRTHSEPALSADDIDLFVRDGFIRIDQAFSTHTAEQACVFRKVPDSDSGKSRTVISESPGQAFR